MPSPYLRRATRGWQFRRAVPQHLRKRFERTEIVRSLARISQHEAVIRAQALGTACEALFMFVEQHVTLTADEIGRVTDHYIRNQTALFEMRLDDLPRGFRSLRQALREEAFIRREMVEETTFTVRQGGVLFSDATVAELATNAGVDPQCGINDRQLRDALALAALRHQDSCADRLKARHPAGIFDRLTRSAQALIRPSLDVIDDGVVVSPPFAGNGSTWNAPDPQPSGMAPETPGALARREEEAALSVRMLPPARLAISASMTATFPAGGWTARAAVRPPPDPPQSMSPATTAPTVNSACLGSDVSPCVLPIAHGRIGPAAADPPLLGEAGIASGPMEAPCDGRFSTVWADFVEDKIRTGEYKRTRRPELKATFRIVVWLAGADPMMTELTPTFMSELRRRFLSLPVDYKNIRIVHEEDRRWRSFDELMAHIAKPKDAGQAFGMVKPKTWNKHKGTISVCVEWAKTNRTELKTLENNVKALHIKVPKTPKAVKLERDMTPSILLVALLRTPVWSGRAAVYHLRKPGRLIIRDSLYWEPILAIGNGLRREEICQLRIRHIIRRFGIWCIDLTGEDVRTKTPDGAGPRLVPIQKEVVAAGIIEALVDGRGLDELLLRDLDNDNAHEAYGVSVGKRISNYVANVDLDFSTTEQSVLEALFCSEDDVNFLSTLDPKRAADIRSKFTNHGIRHWWETTAINAGCNPAHVDELLGHAGEKRGEALRYQKQLHVIALKKTVDQVPMPFCGADLKRQFEAAEAVVIGES